MGAPPVYVCIKIQIDFTAFVSYNKRTNNYYRMESRVFMSSSVFQMRLDDELKGEAAAIYEKLGLDLPTAIRMFLKRTILDNGIPFSMTLPKETYRAERAVEAMRQMSAAAQENGVSELSLKDINDEIAAVRELGAKQE